MNDRAPKNSNAKTGNLGQMADTGRGHAYPAFIGAVPFAIALHAHTQRRRQALRPARQGDDLRPDQSAGAKLSRKAGIDRLPAPVKIQVKY